MGLLDAISPFTGLIGGVASAISGANQRKKDRKAHARAQKEQNRANMELAEYAYQKDLEQWNRANAYNLPENQMKRLKDAGLNPNLVYGTGAVANTQTGQSPKYNAPKLERTALGNRQGIPNLGQYIDTELRQAQVDNIKADTDQKEQMANKTRTETALNNIEVRIKSALEVVEVGKGKVEYRIKGQQLNEAMRAAQREAEEFNYNASRREQQELRYDMEMALIDATIAQKKKVFAPEAVPWVLAVITFLEATDAKLPRWVQIALERTGIDLKKVKESMLQGPRGYNPNWKKKP